MRHVRVNGFEHDQRHRAIYARTTSDGRTLCGAPCTDDDAGRKMAAAWVRLVDDLPRAFAEKHAPMAVEAFDKTCPACLDIVRAKARK